MISYREGEISKTTQFKWNFKIQMGKASSWVVYRIRVKRYMEQINVSLDKGAWDN